MSVLSSIPNSAASELGQRLFNAADRNRDNQISGDEFRSFLTSILGGLDKASPHDATRPATTAASMIAGAGAPLSTDGLPFAEVQGFNFEKLRNESYTSQKYTPSVRLFSKALAATGAQPDAAGLQQIVDWLNAHGATASASKDMLTINGDKPVDVIIDIGGPNASWWFHNVTS